MKLKTLLLYLLVAAVAALAQTTRTLPEGAEIKVRTDTAIPAHPPAGKAYTASVSNDVLDASGAVAIPRGARARLVASPTNNGKDTVLDLRSVTVNNQTYNLAVANSGSSAPGGLGANKRTAKYVGGGAVIGTVLGALLGGGKGAALGALAGGAAGAGAQVYTGRKKDLPPETELAFKTAQPLQMRAAGAAPSSQGLKRRPKAK